VRKIVLGLRELQDENGVDAHESGASRTRIEEKYTVMFVAAGGIERGTRLPSWKEGFLSKRRVRLKGKSGMATRFGRRFKERREKDEKRPPTVLLSAGGNFWQRKV